MTRIWVGGEQGGHLILREQFVQMQKWSQDPFKRISQRNKLRLLQEAALRSGLWPPRICTSPHGQPMTQPGTGDNSKMEQRSVKQRSHNAVGPCL